MPILEAISETLQWADEDDAIRAVVLTGEGEVFSAGADIRVLNRSTPEEVRRLAKKAIAITRHLESMDCITVAALNGDTLGGGLELAEACMLRLAAEDARLGHPEVRIGAIAGFGGTTRLPRLIGRTRATELLLTGDLLSAHEASEIGLINRAVPPHHLRREVEDVIQRILEQAPTAVSLTWEAMHRGLSLTQEAATELGADLFGLAATSNDFREGTQAFLEKRSPDFNHLTNDPS